MNWTLRLARAADVPELEKLIPLSVRALQSPYYSPAQMEAAIGPVFGVDHQLIADGTYFTVEYGNQIIACGGWSKRKSIYGGGTVESSANTELNPKKDAARIRAFFVHPDWARQGIGRKLLAACEEAILAAGFHRAELLATLAGEPLYAAGSYCVVERSAIEMPGGLRLPVVLMARQLRS